MFTDVSELQSGLHGRERREERRIDKASLTAARRYGIKEDAGKGLIKYTYAGITFVYDPVHDKEITSYPSKDYASRVSGTRVTTPTFLRKKYETNAALAERMALQHAVRRTELFFQREAWTSHSVFVVDISGSMRQDDCNGARCRSDGVWLCLAQDHVKQALESKQATDTDLASVVVMGSATAAVVLRCEPTDWILYNKLLDFREWDTLRPQGHGNYLPALKKAEELLEQYDVGRASLSLVFVSDGIPSDGNDRDQQGDEQPDVLASNVMGRICAKFGRRLTVSCIGMADETQDFTVLEEMAKEAQAYHANASFHRAALSTASLSNIFTNVSYTAAASKMELTNLITGNSKMVRTDVRREKHNSPDDLHVTDEWTVYCKSQSRCRTSNYVHRIWVWDMSRDDFVCLMDPRCMVCSTQVVAANSDLEADPVIGRVCAGCKASFVCHACDGGPDHRSIHTVEACTRLLEQRRRGTLVKRPVPSFALAVKRAFFSEGVERLVRKVRFLDSQGNFTGRKMVAKQSRFVEEEGTYEARMDYHRQFLRTQAFASEMATMFNVALDELESSKFPQQLPRVRFLEPLVFELVNEQGEEVNQLVEEMLEGSYEKFNNNMGFVQRVQSGPLMEHCWEGGDSFPISHVVPSDQPAQRTLSARVEDLFQSLTMKNKRPSLAPVVEDDVGGGDVAPCDCLRKDLIERQEEAPVAVDNDGDPRRICSYEVIQAFSHFSFERSKRNLMVVDLQGVLQLNVDGKVEFVLTDPAIHTNRKAVRLSNLNLGRTDRGDKGIASFFKSHVCGEACRLLGLPQSPHC